MIGHQVVGGLYLPLEEKHLAHWVLHSKRAEVVDGKATYQYHKLRAALARVPADRRGVAIDVGAHVGLWSMHLAKAFAKVIAFEPVAYHAELFHMNVTAPAAEVTLVGKAVGAAPAWCTLDRDPAESTGNTHIKHVGNAPDLGSDAVPIVRLDDELLHLIAPGESIDFIKIDVEGYELQVIEGGLETIESYRPVIIVEQKGYEKTYFGNAPKVAVKRLEQLGMAVAEEISGDFIMVWP